MRIVLYVILILTLTALSVLFTKTLSAENCEEKTKTYSQEDFSVTVLEIRPKKEDAKKLVMVMPPTGGVNLIDLSYANRLCEAGVAASVVKTWSGHDEESVDLEYHTRFYKRAQKAIGILVEEYAELQLGILGTSVGGLHAAIAASRFEEIRKSFLIGAGGNIAGIIAQSKQEPLVTKKEKRFELYGFKDEKDYEEALEKVVPFEPLNMRVHKTKKLGMVIFKNDEIVPSSTQVRLARHWSPGYLKKLSYGHTPSIIWTWLFHSDEIVDFFAEEKK